MLYRRRTSQLRLSTAVALFGFLSAYKGPKVKKAWFLREQRMVSLFDEVIAQRKERIA